MHSADILTKDPGALFRWALSLRSATLMTQSLAAASRKRSSKACACDPDSIDGSRRLPVLIAAEAKLRNGKRTPYPIAYVTWIEGYGAALRAEILEVPLPLGLFREIFQHGLAELCPDDDWEWVIPAAGTAQTKPSAGALPWAALRAAALANVATVAPEALVLRISLAEIASEELDPAWLTDTGTELHSSRIAFMQGPGGAHTSRLLTFELSPGAAARWRVDCPISTTTDTLPL